jgi:hypothetical protein
MDINDIAAFVFVSGGVACVIIKIREWTRPKEAKTEAPPQSLDTPLMVWDELNDLTPRDLLAGGLHAYGRTGSGKTSSLWKLARSILAHKNSSLLVLCPKMGEHKQWMKLARSVGRGEDIVLIDPKNYWRFNMVGHWVNGPAGVESVVRFIMELRTAVFREQQSSGGDHSVWRQYEEVCIRNCVVALKCAGEDITAGNIHKLIISAPSVPSVIDTKEWQAGYCNEVLKKGHCAKLPTIERNDFEQARDYLAGVWPGMGDRTQGSILMGVVATLNAMNTGIAREMFGEETNITPKQAIEGRKIVIVNMSPDQYGSVGLLANIGWKYCWQKEVLKRDIEDDSPIAGVWGDESSLWVSDFDAEYLSRCRSYQGFQVYICQSLANYQATLPSGKSEAIIDALLSNFSHKLFFALGDSKTAEWAANLCGKELQILSGGSVQHSPFSLVPSNAGDTHSTSFHEQYEYAVRPEEFMNGMRTGSPVNDYRVDAILVRSGKAFASGFPMLSVTFDQREL